MVMLQLVTNDDEPQQTADVLEERRLIHLVAADTGAALVTIRKRLQGKPVRGIVGARIDASIARHRAA